MKVPVFASVQQLSLLLIGSRDFAELLQLCRVALVDA